MSREERRVLEQLNSRQSADASVPQDSVTEFLERGLAEENSFGQVVITARGQLELARDRYSRIRRSRYAVTGKVRKRPLWERLLG